jgi:hypothetical protein
MLGPLESLNIQAQCLRLYLSKIPNRVGNSFPLSETETDPVQKKYFYSYLEFVITSKVYKLNDSEYLTRLPHPFRYFL